MTLHDIVIGLMAVSILLGVLYTASIPIVYFFKKKYFPDNFYNNDIRRNTKSESNYLGRY